MRTLGSGWNDVIGLEGKPGIGARAAEEFDDFAVNRAVVKRLAAAFTEKNGDRNSPNPLARDAPVGARRNHIGEAFFAPGRIPFDALDLTERARAQRVLFSLSAGHRRFHGDKPLFGGAKDDR